MRFDSSPTNSMFSTSLKAAALSFMIFGCTTLNAAEPAAGRQGEHELQFEDGSSIEYQLYIPDGYHASKPHAFILFLHGRGESNGPCSLVKKWGPPRLVEAGVKLNYIIASPQCPPEPARWNDETRQKQLGLLLAHLEKRFSIDKSRMYLTGLSMGGEGVWTLAANLQNKFAAMVPVCGATEPKKAKAYLDLPIWIWHGTDDTAVPYSESTDIVEAITKAGGDKVRLTSLEHVGHNSWSAAYGTPQLYSWLNKHQLGKSPK